MSVNKGAEPNARFVSCYTQRRVKLTEYDVGECYTKCFEFHLRHLWQRWWLGVGRLVGSQHLEALRMLSISVFSCQV